MFGGVLHNVLVDLVHSLEETSLFGHLLHDVFRAENGLQVEPLGLYFEPLIYRILRPHQLCFPPLRDTVTKYYI